MPKVFKKNQKILATLPNGRVLEGIYIEPYGSNGHSFYVNEFNGTDKNGKPRYKQHRYGVKDENIEAISTNSTPPSESQYRAWLKRAVDLESRINEIKREMEDKKNDDTAMAKLNEKLNRTNDKLKAINEKIKEFE